MVHPATMPPDDRDPVDVAAQHRALLKSNLVACQLLCDQLVNKRPSLDQEFAAMSEALRILTAARR